MRMISSLNGTSSLVRAMWRVRSLVQDPLGVLGVCMEFPKKIVDCMLKLGRIIYKIFGFGISIIWHSPQILKGSGE